MRDIDSIIAAYLLPSAQTMWRSLYRDFRFADATLSHAMDLSPELWKRDADKIRRIEQAEGIEALLDLTVEAVGVAEDVWRRRMAELGPSARPNIVARFDSDWIRSHASKRPGIFERLIGVLRWCDEPDAVGIRQIWACLNQYERSLACITIGLLGARNETKRLWDFFEQTRASSETHALGALWALIDLGSERAADALSSLLNDGRAFYEKYGFLARAGDQRAVVPLMFELENATGRIRENIVLALAGIAHRVGREAMYDALRFPDDNPGVVDVMAGAITDGFLSYSQQDVENQFDLFYDLDHRSHFCGQHVLQ